MIRGYVRVSTESQRDNNSIEAQTEQLRAEGAEVIYTDVMSGAKLDRPEFTRLMSDLQSGDMLICTKLDRISRTATDGYELIQSLIKRGIKVRVCNIGTMENTPTGNLILHVFLAFAEFEREMIRQRMAEGKAVARRNPNYHEGRPKQITKKQLDHAMDMLKDHSYTQVAETLKISKSTLARERRRRKAEQIEKEREANKEECGSEAKTEQVIVEYTEASAEPMSIEVTEEYAEPETMSLQIETETSGTTNRLRG